MTRGGRTKRRDVAERRCAVSGASGPRTRLIRFVVAPNGQVAPDIRGRLPGRGIWVSASREALGKAVSRNLFARAARKPVLVPDGLVDQVETQLAGRLVELLSLARKCGIAFAGFEKTRRALEAGQAIALLQAVDGSPRQKARLRPPSGEQSLIACMTAGEIGLAFGREHVIHAAVGEGGVARKLILDALRLSGMRNPGRSGAGKQAGAETQGEMTE